MYLTTISEDQRRLVANAALDRSLRLGMIVVGVLVFGVGTFAATLPIASAVVASGEVSVESRVKRIGHPSGGIIADLPVRDGDHVRKGQLLMRLDSTISGAEATMTAESADQLLARIARLRAERDDLAAIAFPAALRVRANDPVIAALMREEDRTFRLRREARRGQLAQLDQRIRQTQSQAGGYSDQAVSLKRQGALMNEELAAAQTLWAKRFTTLQRVKELERGTEALNADAALALTSEAQTRARLSEIEQQKLALGQDARSQASTELNEVEAKWAELRQRKVAADATDRHNVLRAPQDGIVDKLAFATIGGVVPPNETIMEIVPDSDRLIVVAHIRPSDIDQVQDGQAAALRFSAFNMRTTPEVNGTVATVSANRSTDEKSGAAFYTARVLLAPGSLGRLHGLKLRPGMPAEVFIRTGERTMLGYIVKPLRDQIARAFRAD